MFSPASSSRWAMFQIIYDARLFTFVALSRLPPQILTSYQHLGLVDHRHSNIYISELRIRFVFSFSPLPSSQTSLQTVLSHRSNYTTHSQNAQSRPCPDQTPRSTLLSISQSPPRQRHQSLSSSCCQTRSQRSRESSRYRACSTSRLPTEQTSQP